MDTGPIENFAQKLRNRLRDGVKQRLLYWGFDDQGGVIEEPEPVEGGYLFRGEVFSDETVPYRWKQLKKMIEIHDVDYVIEEGAYTWFNRLMAIRILEKNNYIQPQLEYEDGTSLPYLLQNARRGIFPEMQEKQLEELNKKLREHKDNEAFARLLTHFCDSNTLISNVFGKISYREDYTELLLPQNLLDQEGILDFIVTTDAITDEDFEQVELIGWLYQFYISEKKDEVFKSFSNRKKAGPEELPAATQIFTPEWIVRYMVENTVGRLWMDLHPDSDLIERMDYYVEPSDENPNAEPIIEDVTDLTLMDPAAGSGHILVVGFEYLMEMYREEGYTARQSVENILQNNLYGLEIDERAAQLARFAVLLKAAKYDQSVLDGNKQPKIQSFPEKTEISTAEIREFLGVKGEEYVDEFRDALDILQHGKNYGSTIQIDTSWEAIEEAKKRISNLGSEAIENLATQELLHKVEPYVNVIELLQKEYKAVAANPPYMNSKNYNSNLKEYLYDNYSDSKRDLFSIFIEVSLNKIQEGGIAGIINQHSWMFLSSFKKIRRKVVDNTCIESMLHLGPRAFDEISGEVVQSVSFTFRKKINSGFVGKYFRLTKGKNTEEKCQEFLNTKPSSAFCVNQDIFRDIPDSTLAYWISERTADIFKNFKRVKTFAESGGRCKTHNDSKYVRYFWELDNTGENDWKIYNKGGPKKRWYGNIEYFVDWSKKARKQYDKKGGLTREKYWNTKGITWSGVSTGRASYRLKIKESEYSSASPTIMLQNGISVEELLGYLNSVVSEHFMEIINPTLQINVGDALKLPYKKCNEKESVERLVKECIEISESAWNYKETSPYFKVNELIEVNEHGTLKESVKLLVDEKINRVQTLLNNEEELNRVFIQHFKLSEELSPKVDVDSLTILDDELNVVSEGEEFEISETELIKQLLSYLVGVLFGRYKLGTSGFYITNSDKGKMDSYKFKNSPIHLDDDGIIPIIEKDSPFSDDLHYKIKELLGIVWDEEKLTDSLNFIKEKLRTNLDDWLSNKFWDYHKKKYSKTPIYWLFSSSNGAFKVLTYMHRMDKYTVQKVRQNYLHPYMDYLRNEIEKLDKKDTLSSDESKRMDQLRSDLNECLEYDEILKEVADKQIDFDLDDGVDHNYELFDKALAKI